MEKQFEYAVKLNEQIAEMFQEDSQNFIDINDFNDEDNATAFIHALANVMPTRIFNKLTSDNKNMLEFNHVANQLVFQFSEKSQ